MNALPEVGVDVEASYAALTSPDGFPEHHGLQIWKTVDDMARYRHIIEATRPTVVVETGTHQGGFAAWLVSLGLLVITVDVASAAGRPARLRGVRFVHGDSVAAKTLTEVRSKIPSGCRVMVTLDSEHAAPHVVAEIGAYGELVSPGCYLVVEDGLADLVGAHRSHLFGATVPQLGGPLSAITQTLTTDGRWVRDVDVENLTAVSHNPAGWWRRVT